MEELNISPASFLSLIIPLLMMLISIYYASKKLSTDSILLVAGSVIVLMTAIAFSFSPYYFHQKNMPFTSISIYYSVIGMIAFIGGFIFAGGFLMIVLKIIQYMKESEMAIKKDF